MTGFIIDPKIVDSNLVKPIELERELKIARGEQPDGNEPVIFYTEAELQLIREEDYRLFGELSRGAWKKPASDSTKRFVLTAGAPGAGKTTLLEWLLAVDPELAYAVYADPDESILKFMRPYQDDVAAGGDTLEARIKAYTKWRWASIYIAGRAMNKACALGYDIAHGTTATGGATHILYENAKREGYEIATHIVAAPDSVRVESSNRRFAEKGDRYTPDYDVVNKGKMFWERLPLYFEKSDNFSLYWRDGRDHSAVLAAEGRGVDVFIHNRLALIAFADALSKNRPDLSWGNLSAHYKHRFSAASTPAPTPPKP